jgi:dTDP-4-dehydrorhamnose reductase
MGWDLLCGMVKPGHALWERLVGYGLEDRLRVIAEDPCPPAVIGVNHYLASERLRDHRVELYPHRAVADREVGKYGGVPFVDVDAIRNLRTPMIGLPGLLRQAWERYGIPVAVTEVHNGASREEQVRWFVEVWDSVIQLRKEGVDIPAVTAWSLLGAHDWNRMVTRFVGHYEVGVYDVRSGTPRPTMLAPVLKDLAEGRRPQAVGLGSPGWWRRPNRFVGAPQTGPSYDLSRGAQLPEDVQPLLIIGSEGPLTRLLTGFSEARGLYYRRVSRADEALIRAVSPWAVVDGRDWAGVCESPEGAYAGPFQRGFAPPEALVKACAAAEVPCAVFTATTDFQEIDERLLELGGPRLLLAGSERLFMPWERARFAGSVLDQLDAGLP